MGESAVKVDAWNKALRKIGHTKRIESEDDTSVAAAACRDEWDDCVGEALELRDWPFARKGIALARLSDVTRVGWEYAYALPDDFVAARALLTGGQRLSLTPGDERVPYEIQGDDALEGLVFLTDMDLDATSDALIYTGRHLTVARWPRLFLSAVSWRLAAELGLAIVKGAEGSRLAQGCLASFESALRVAYATVANQEQADPELDPPSILARR